MALYMFLFVAGFTSLEQWLQRELKGGWRKKEKIISRDAVGWTRRCVASVKVSER